MSRKKPCVHCYSCNAELRKLPPEKTHHRGVHFCNLHCFNNYMNLVRPVQPKIYMPERETALRALARLEELKGDVLFSAPSDHANIVREEIIFELTYVVEGHWRVTRAERSIPEVIPMAMKVKVRI